MSTERCKITDLIAENPWDVEAEDTQPPYFLGDIKLKDIMSGEHSCWLGKSRKIGKGNQTEKFIFEISDTLDYKYISSDISEQSLDNIAWFCQEFLWHYDKLFNK